AVPTERVDGRTNAAAVPGMRGAGATVHIVEMRRSPLRLRNVGALLEVRQLIRSIDARIVHGHSSIGGALARIAALGTRRPCVYTPNGLATGAVPLRIERLLARRTARIIAASPSEAALLRERRIASGDR